MLRIYGTENLTQRNDHSSAIAGLIAGTIKLLARRDFNEPTSSPEIRRSKPTGSDNYGIGRDRIFAELEGLRGVNDNLIKQQLGVLIALRSGPLYPCDSGPRLSRAPASVGVMEGRTDEHFGLSSASRRQRH
jgi:hypothetical protein